MRTKLLMMTMFALNIFASEELEPNISAEGVTRKYLSALENLDYEAYYSSIFPQARANPFLASQEAMHFWHEELEQAVERGFCQNFEILVEDDASKNESGFPQAVAVFKDCDGKMMDVSLFLLFENGSWWALGLNEYHH